MEKYAIIVAGGSGSRMNSDVPKQFLILKGKPVLYYSINSFLQTYDDCKIILVLAEEHIGKGQEIVDAFFDYKKITITVGGRTRFHSVQNGLKLIKNEDAIVFVHDAARPLLSSAMIYCCYNSAIEFGSAIPVIDCKDSLRILTIDGNEALERSTIKLVQTPQAFHAKIILHAFLNIDFKDKFTDEASVVEAFGLKVSLVEGDIQNIKITTPIDLLVAEAMINKNE
jgi:2-C-methyl-D-erythritol 4-phosphate cytidylyltransferase